MSDTTGGRWVRRKFRILAANVMNLGITNMEAMNLETVKRVRLIPETG
jgi:hypothetical protein